MKLVYSFNINNDITLLNLCKISKELYNQTLYEVRQGLKDNKFIYYYDMLKIMSTKPNLNGEINYRLLKIQVSQQIIKSLDKNLKSYFKSIKLWSKDKTKFKGKPKLPNYKKNYNNLIYTNQSSTIRDGYIHLSKTLKINIPQFDKYKDRLSTFNQIRVIPKNGYIKIEIVYDVETVNVELNYNEFGSIDLGINNLISLVTELNNPILISGKQIKSINQWFNKQLSKLQSIKDKQRISKSTKKINNLYEERNNQLKDLFHKITRFIVNYLVKNKIGNLVVGYNKNWKDSISIGRINNQKFVQIPYLQLMNYLKYKCNLVGINLIETEESYTSKTDSLSLESIQKNDTFLGKRIKRGLFQSNTGKLINSDINGSLNILRKVVGDSKIISKIIDSGLLFNPIKIRNLYNINSNFLLKN